MTNNRAADILEHNRACITEAMLGECTIDICDECPHNISECETNEAFRHAIRVLRNTEDDLK